MNDHGQRAKQLFTLRVTPWWTDGCSTFFNNVFKWLPNILNRDLTCLEFGGGNSTFYLLGKGVKVVTIESDDEYINFIYNITKDSGYRCIIISPGDFEKSLFSDYQLIVIKSTDIIETENIIDKFDWDLIVDDGISRKDVLEEIYKKNKNVIIVLDNVEYSANWGRLDRTSAKPDLIKVYRSILRDKNWRHCIFEQDEGRDGRGSADKCGWESPHRWMSAVLWPDNHLFSKLIVSNIGFPLVNELGADDSDIETLNERCPFDWDKMKWKKSSFPGELDLKLNRTYE